MAITLPSLPYAYDALAPSISARTLEFHHDKHHKAYVDKTNELIAGTKLADSSLEDIITAAAADRSKTALFNNAAQAWNHDFYWHSMRPQGGGAPKGPIAERLKDSFKSVEAFGDAFKKVAVEQFGSGWAWLVVDKGKLAVMATGNADTPIGHGKTPLVTIDVWEHAYYLDYQNRRADYIARFLEKLVNWEFANENLERAIGRDAAE